MNTTLDLVDFFSISPFFIILAAALLVLLAEAFSEAFAKNVSLPLTLAALAAAVYAIAVSPESVNPLLTLWIRFDFLAQLFNLFFVLIAFACALLSASFFRQYPISQGEYYFLLLSSVFGLMLIGSAADFLTLFIGLETLSISLYILCGYMKNWGMSNEASLKYFLMGALAAALLLYGIALVYGAVGTTNFDALLNGYNNIASTQGSVLFLSGIALVTLGLAFKAAIVPFHVWAPDVYCGAPTPVTAFMAVGTKVGAFAAFVVVFFVALPMFNAGWNNAIAYLAVPTLIYANMVAIKQSQMRRFFAYSGISHAGFLLIPLAVNTPEALTALLFYLAVYAFATLGSFAVLATVDVRESGASIHDLQGLFRRSPFLAAVLALCLLTLAGIPPTAGFLAKFFVFKVAFQSGYYALVVIALLTTILSAYYYLRIIATMFMGVSEEVPRPKKSWMAAVVGGGAIASIIALSLYPQPLLDFFGF